MGSLILRSTIIYILILCVFRLMGKRQIGQLQPFELVLTLIIADLATIPMAETTLPILHGIVPLLTLLIVHFIITTICIKSNTLNKLINGKPVIVMSPKGIDFENLKLLCISVDDLLEGLRAKGYFSFEQIEYAIVETTGIINVIPKVQFSNVTLEDLKIKKENNTLPITIISEGTCLKDNMNKAAVDFDFIAQILKQAKVKQVKDCEVLTIDDNGQVYIQGKGADFLTIQTNHKGKNKI